MRRLVDGLRAPPSTPLDYPAATKHKQSAIRVVSVRRSKWTARCTCMPRLTWTASAHHSLEGEASQLPTLSSSRMLPLSFVAQSRELGCKCLPSKGTIEVAPVALTASLQYLPQMASSLSQHNHSF